MIFVFKAIPTLQVWNLEVSVQNLGSRGFRKGPGGYDASFGTISGPDPTEWCQGMTKKQFEVLGINVTTTYMSA